MKVKTFFLASPSGTSFYSCLQYFVGNFVSEVTNCILQIAVNSLTWFHHPVWMGESKKLQA